jgi:simple sugar transport system permease protein
MNDLQISLMVAAILAGAAPIVLAALGETISEKAGVINLSLDGSILLSAMIAFAVSLETGSLLAGTLAGMIAGGVVAAVVAVFSLYLNQSQVAVGFVLTLMTRDLAYFMGNSYSRVPGPQMENVPIPLLTDIPFLGEILFTHHLIVYLSLVLIPGVWWFLYRTHAGLQVRAVGENPLAAHIRGIQPSTVQLIYAIVGGLLVGLAGAAFSLSVKPGWGRPQGAEGTGWIALALVIFGGWHPIRAAIGAYLFSWLQIMSIHFQEWFPFIPAQVFQVAPFPMMILMLLVVNLLRADKMEVWMENRPLWRNVLSALTGSAPAGLGKVLKKEY